MYTVKQVADKLEMNPHTVRFYTDKELIPGLKRGENNVRLFDEDAIGWLQGVKALRISGMSVESIKKYVDLCLKGEEAIPERLEIIKEQQEKVNAQLAELKQSSQFLVGKVHFYENLLDGKETIDRGNPAEMNKIRKELTAL
ncbi:MerR family transcriptional regulator [Carnobacterium mobile]|uniref:MerR family transcriptional regulator n=1 Tax=Carnobacterium mobile TaxID=2750 RepID=UPI001866F9B4|nr:MerR family transcriptional regulator [Carnobacterium mobile]